MSGRAWSARPRGSDESAFADCGPGLPPNPQLTNALSFRSRRVIRSARAARGAVLNGPPRTRATGRDQCDRIWPRKLRVRSRLRIAEELLRRRHLDDLAPVHEDHPVGDAAGEAHLVRDAEHGHAVFGEADHGVEHLLDHLRIERRGRLVEQHDLGLHAQRPGDRHALLLAARELRRDTCWPARGCARAPGSCMRRRLGLGLASAARTFIGASMQFSSTVRCGNRLNCWNTMPTSRRTASMFLASAPSSMPSTTIRPLLMVLELVDAADHRRFAGARGAADDDPLAACARRD